MSIYPLWWEIVSFALWEKSYLHNENKRYVTKAVPLYRARGDIYHPFMTRNCPHLVC